MPLSYVCVAPHPGDLIPETVEDKNIVALTCGSIQAVGEKLKVPAPEVIVIINPQGLRV